MSFSLVNLLVFLTALAAFECLALEAEIVQKSKIVGGVITTIEQHPYQANLLGCGGSIIGKRWILTAAHCQSRYYILVGSGKSNEGKKMYVKRIIRYPSNSYVPLSSDIALWELMSDLTFGDNIKPIQLGRSRDLKVGATAVVTGWGSMTSDGIMSNLLREVKVPIFDQNKCIKAYRKVHFIVDETMVCAGFGDGGKDSCQGDSGGPLTIGNKLVGVVSWGKDCAVPHYPGVYTRVPLYREWIRTITGI